MSNRALLLLFSGFQMTDFSDFSSTRGTSRHGLKTGFKPPIAVEQVIIAHTGFWGKERPGREKGEDIPTLEPLPTDAWKLIQNREQEPSLQDGEN